MRPPSRAQDRNAASDLAKDMQGSAAICAASNVSPTTLLLVSKVTRHRGSNVSDSAKVRHGETRLNIDNRQKKEKISSPPRICVKQVEASLVEVEKGFGPRISGSFQGVRLSGPTQLRWESNAGRRSLVTMIHTGSTLATFDE